MAERINLSKITKAEIARLPAFIAVKACPKNRESIIVFRREDAAELVEELGKYGVLEERYLSPSYWEDLSNDCMIRLSPTKSLTAKPTSKKRKRYFHMYDWKAMARCNPSGCSNRPGCACRAVQTTKLTLKFCGCRA